MALGLFFWYSTSIKKFQSSSISNDRYVHFFIRGHYVEGRQIDVLQLMLDASEADVDNVVADGVNATAKKRLSDDEIIANSWIFLLGKSQDH